MSSTKFLPSWLRIRRAITLILMIVLLYVLSPRASALDQQGISGMQMQNIQGSYVDTQFTLPEQGVQVARLGVGRLVCRFFGFCLNRRKEVRRPAANTVTGQSGRKGPCSDLNPRALIPVFTDRASQELPGNIINSIGFTASVTPTLWFYIPGFKDPNKSSIKLAEFALQDGKDKDIFDPPLLLLLSDKPGIVSFTLHSEHVAKLQPKQPYHWYLSIICDSRRPSRNPWVDGWIEQEDNAKKIELADQLRAVRTSADQVKVYADNDLWYDTLTNLVEFRCKNRNDPKLAEYWSNFLKEVGLTQDIPCNPEQHLKVLP